MTPREAAAQLFNELPTWETTTAIQRLHDCCVMLRLWGLLSEGDYTRVRGRLEKLMKHHCALAGDRMKPLFEGPPDASRH